MNKQQIVQMLQMVQSRRSLAEIKDKICREGQQDRFLQDLCKEIDQILALPSLMPAGIDHQLIRTRCADLAASVLQEQNSQEPLPHPSRITEQVLASLSDEDLLQTFRIPIHKKCTLHQGLPKQLAIQNEYDVQQMLYWIFRLIFPECALELPQNDGYGGLRPDLSIAEDLIIEIKSTQRDSMTERELIEEITADMTRFSQKYHYFFIYDARRLISDRHQFISTYEGTAKKMPDKRIRIFISRRL